MTKAGMLWVPTGNSYKPLAEFTDNDWADLKSLRGTRPEVKAGKQVREILDALEKLGGELDRCTGQPHTGHNEPPSAAAAPSRALASTMALVPYVPTVRMDTQARPAPNFIDGSNRIVADIEKWLLLRRSWLRPYIVLFKFLGLCVYLIPLIVIYVAVAYTIIGMMAIVSNPGLLVKGVFLLGDSVPTYFDHARASIWNATYEEVSIRFFG